MIKIFVRGSTELSKSRNTVWLFLRGETCFPNRGTIVKYKLLLLGQFKSELPSDVRNTGVKFCSSLMLKTRMLLEMISDPFLHKVL